MDLIINNYEVQEASTFFSMSDIISALTALIAIVTLVVTLISNKKSLNKTLGYETNKKNLLEINEVAVSVKETEHEILKLVNILEKVYFKETGQFRVFDLRDLTEQMNYLGEKIMHMEIQFDLKSYKPEIRIMNEEMNEDSKKEIKKRLMKKIDVLLMERSMLETTSDRNNDKYHKRLLIGKMCEDIIKEELNDYFQIINNVKDKLLSNIANINNSDFS